jgi:hypothetical protein
MQEYRLPETFLERRTRVSVQYDLKLHISRGKLRASSEYVSSFPSIGFELILVKESTLRLDSFLAHDQTHLPFFDNLRTSKVVLFLTTKLILMDGNSSAQSLVVVRYPSLVKSKHIAQYANQLFSLRHV